jgi:hypothetical protein
MPDLRQFMAAFSDQLPIYQAHGGSSSLVSDSEEALYKAQLQQRMLDEKRAFDRSELAKLGEVSARLNQNAETALPNMDNRTRLAMHYAAALGALNMVENSQQGLVQGGVPTSNIKEYEASQSDPGLAAFLKAKHQENIPAALAIAAAMAKQEGLAEPTTQMIKEAAHIANPEQASAVEASKEYAKKGAEDITKKVNDFPTTLFAHKNFTDQVDSMSTAIQESINLIKNDPSSSGLAGTISKYLPETEANQLRMKLETIGSGIAIETLTDLKKSSPTGASGFGALSENELRVIKGLYGVLEQSNDPKVLIKTLSEIDRRIKRVQDISKATIRNDAAWIKTVGPKVPDLYGHVAPLVDKILSDEEPSTKPRVEPKPEPVIRRKWGE